MAKAVRPLLLSGIRVLDLTADGSIFCGRVLAELGARVTRIEMPSGQNGTAHLWGKDVDDGLRLAFKKAGGEFASLNLESEDGRDAFRQMAASADGIVETFRPGYLESLGLDFKALSAVNPRLIVVSVTGFGNSGPRRDWVSCDLTVAALGGQLYVTGRPGKPPLEIRGGWVGYLGVLFAVNGLLLAIHQRSRTCHGQHVDISLQECITAALDYVLPQYFGDGVVPQRQGSLTWNGNFEIFRCRDGYFLVSVPGDRGMLVDWLSRSRADRDLVLKKGHIAGLHAGNTRSLMLAIGRWIRGRSCKELFRGAQLRRLPWAPVLKADGLVKNRQLRSRRFFVNLKVGGPSVVAVPGALPFRVDTTTPAGKARCAQPIMTGAYGPPLSGVRVLDFTWVMAGPYATRLLADFGAEVIKVQSRRVPGTEVADRTAYFKYWNRGKRSVTLDMSQPDGVALARRLIRLSDVVIESFSPRVMENWGLSPDVILQEKPDLIMVSMSAFGRTGPWRNYVAFGPTVHALSGLAYSTRYGSGRPLGPGFALADHVAGLYAGMAVMAALENRRRTGEGVFVDLSQFEAMCVLTAGRRNTPIAAPYGVYPCRGKDSWCAIAVSGDDAWRRFCDVMGAPWLAFVPEFATAEARLQNRIKLDRGISKWTSKFTAGEVMSMLEGARICAGVVQSARDLAFDEHLKARGFFVELVDGERGKLVFDGTPIRLSEGQASINRGAPVLGEGNEYVYCDLLGMSRDELADYIKRGVVY